MLLTLAQNLAPSTATATMAASDLGPLPAILFYVIAVLVVGGAVFVALSRNIVRQAVGLLFCLTGMSGFYFLLHAEFLAAVQLVVYVGGTLILIVFGVMLTSQNPRIHYSPKKREVLWVLALGTVLTVGLIALLLRTQWAVTAAVGNTVPGGETAGQDAVKSLGQLLLDPNGYLAPFELVSIVLLAVMIGAAYLAKIRKAPALNSAPKKQGGV